jgi:hypothetical protein
MKADAIADARNAAKENTILVIILDAGGIPLVAHRIAHGFTP